MTALSPKYLPSDSSTPDIANINDVSGYTHLLLMLSRLPDRSPDAPDRRELAMTMRRWSDGIRRQMPHYAPEHLRCAIECYDLTHRFGYNERPDKRYIDQYRRRYFGSWARGNDRINESDIYAMVSQMAVATPDDIDSRQFSAFYDIRERWMKQLRYNTAFAETAPVENYRRLSLVMQENLRPWFRFDQRSRKRQWAESNTVADLRSLDTPTLLSYKGFNLSLWPSVNPDAERNRTYDTAIARELVARPDLNRFERLAFTLTETI